MSPRDVFGARNQIRATCPLTRGSCIVFDAKVLRLGASPFNSARNSIKAERISRLNRSSDRSDLRDAAIHGIPIVRDRDLYEFFPFLTAVPRS